MNINTLIIGEQEIILDVLALALEGSLDAEITVKDNLQDALDILSTTKVKIDLVVYDSKSSNQAVGEEIASLLKFGIPVFAMLATEHQQPTAVEPRKNLHILHKPIQLAALIDSVRAALPGLLGSLGAEDYCKIKLESLLLSGEMFDFDIYVKLSDKKFAKILNKGHRFNISDYAHYSVKKLNYLYLRQSDFIGFLNKFAEGLQSVLLDESKPFNIESALNISMSVQEVLYEAISDLGFSSELQRLTKVSVDLAVNSIRNSPEISELFSALMEDKSSYAHWHSTALCYVACLLSSKMTWDSENTHYKLALAAILHDISLKDRATADIIFKEDIKTRIPKMTDRNAYLQHPLAAAELAKEMKDFPGDVDYIISQHHEMPDGSGFPLGINHTKISPLSALFIVAHHLSYEIYQKKRDFNLATYVATASPMFNKGYFKKIMGELARLSG